MLFQSVFEHGKRASMRPVARAISRSADGYLFVLVPVSLSLADIVAISSLAPLLVTALLIERSCYWSLKNTLKRKRPQDSIAGFNSLINPADQFSFPSGHTSAAFMLATCMTLINQELATTLYIWATSVAISRVILGVHYPGDTVAGALMGSSIAVIVGTATGV